MQTTTKHMMRGFFVACMAVAGLSAWADTDENNMTPSFWYQASESGFVSKGSATIADDFVSGAGSVSEESGILTIDADGYDKNLAGLNLNASNNHGNFSVMIKAQPVANGENKKVVLAAWNPNFNANDGAVFAVDPSTGKVYYFRGNAQKIESTAVENMTEQVHTYIFTGNFSGSSVKIYVDGELIASTSASGCYPNTTRTAFAFGTAANGGTAALLDTWAVAEGTQVSEFRVYRGTELTEPQVAKICGVAPKACRIGETRYNTLADALTAVAESTDKTIVMLDAVTENAEIPEGVTIEVPSTAILNGTVSGAGTIKLTHPGTGTQGQLGNFVGTNKIVFGTFTGKIHLASGRFETTATVASAIPADSTIKVTDGAQLSIGAGTWACDIELSGRGYGNETAHIGRAALRYEGGTISGTVTTIGSGDDAPAIGSYNQNIDFAFKVAGTGDLRLVRGSGAHTIKLSNADEMIGAITIVDQNLILEYTVGSGEKTVTNAIAGSGSLKKTGEGALKLTGDVACAITLSAGTIVASSDSLTVTTDVQGKIVKKDTAEGGLTTYSLGEDQLTWETVTASTPLNKVLPNATEAQLAAITAANKTAADVATWALAIGVNGNPGVELDVECFAMNCSPSEKEATMAAFKVNFDDEGYIVIEGADNFNIEPILLNSSDLKTWAEGTDGNFFKAVIEL